MSVAQTLVATPDPLPGRVAQCSRCGAPIVWARTVMSETGAGGRAMPLDLYPDPAGNVAVSVGVDRRLRARTLQRDENHDRHTEQVAMPHFATCKKAAR